MSVAPDSVEIRPAARADIPALVDFRVRMFLEMGWEGEDRVREVGALFSEFLERTMADGTCVGWVALDETGVAVGGCSLMWEHIPPSVRNPSGRQAYVFGIFVEPHRRRRGIARALVRTAVDHAVAEECAVVSLHAFEAARPLYESLGFTDSSELRYFTSHAQLAQWHPEQATGEPTG